MPVRPDIGLSDIVLGLVKLSRPLPSMDPKLDDEVVHQQLTLYLDGLRAIPFHPSALSPRSIEDLDRALEL